MAMATRAAISRSSARSYSEYALTRVDCRSITPTSLPARRHGHSQLGAHGVDRVQVARIVPHVTHQHRLPSAPPRR